VDGRGGEGPLGLRNAAPVVADIEAQRPEEDAAHVQVEPLVGAPLQHLGHQGEVDVGIGEPLAWPVLGGSEPAAGVVMPPTGLECLGKPVAERHGIGGAVPEAAGVRQQHPGRDRDIRMGRMAQPIAHQVRGVGVQV
jgi:hypothetical protein